MFQRSFEAFSAYVSDPSRAYYFSALRNVSFAPLSHSWDERLNYKTHKAFLSSRKDSPGPLDRLSTWESVQLYARDAVQDGIGIRSLAKENWVARGHSELISHLVVCGALVLWQKFEINPRCLVRTCNST